MNAAGRTVPAWKPVVGSNMFAHESGIHVDGVIKNPKTYEIFSPEEVGLERQIVVGKHSGSRTVELKFAEYGIEITREDANAILPTIRHATRRAAPPALRQGTRRDLQRLQGIDAPAPFSPTRRLTPLPGKTIAEKIFSAHSGTDAHAGDIVIADVDFVMGQDGTSPLAIKALEKMGVTEVFDPKKVAVVMDHSSPSPIEGVSALHTMMREFGKRTGATVYDVGEGVCHQLIPEKGHVVAGDLMVGCDSPHLHVRRDQRVLDRRRLDRRRGRDGLGQAVVQGARHHEGHLRGRAAAGRVLQGPHPVPRRQDRCGRRDLRGHRVPRPRHRRPVGRGPHDHLATWRSRSARRPVS